MATTAQEIVKRIQGQFGASWKDTPVDTFLAGTPVSEVKGIVTTYAPSLQVLHKSVESGHNLIIARESPFWARDAAQLRPGTGGFGPAGPGGGGAGGGSVPTNDPIYQTKRDYIAANNLIVYRFFENWDAQKQDPQLKALAKALGWEQYYKPSGGQAWAVNNGFFEIPPSTLKETAQNIKKTLRMKSIRCGGDPNVQVRKVALSHGMYWLSDIQQLLAEPNVDVLVMGEPQWENELCLYNFDLHAAGENKGLILLGQEASEEPGCGEMAAWLKSFIKDVPVEWIPAGEPAWMPS